MIELYDKSRLAPSRDPSLQVAAAVLVVGVLVVAGRWWLLQRDWDDTQVQVRQVAAALAEAKRQPPPPAPALLADLEQTAQRLEAEVQALGGPAESGMLASHWLQRLESLSAPDVGLNVVEVDRQGHARVEGQARSPQSLSAYVQAWERQQAHAPGPGQTPVRVHALEALQDEKAAPMLRFQLRAALPVSDMRQAQAEGARP